MDETTQIPVENSQPARSEIDRRFRPQYRVLADHEKLAVGALKEQATDLAKSIDLLPSSREKSLALTKLEECVMWAVKAATAPPL